MSVEVSTSDLINILDRAVFFFRYGSTAFGAVSLEGFLALCQPPCVDEIKAAADLGYYLCVADLLLYKVRPILKATKKLEEIKTSEVRE